MARHNWKAVHVRTLEELPKNLKLGRAYFIDDEGIILVNHGDSRGVQVYGNRPGAQGIPGEPLPEIESNIDELARASVQNTKALYNEIIKRRKSISQEESARIEQDKELARQIDSLSHGLIQHSKAIYHETKQRCAESEARSLGDSVLQEQIDTLAEASLSHSKAIKQETSARAGDSYASKANFEKLQQQADKLALASVKNTIAIFNEERKRKNEESARLEHDERLQLQVDSLAASVIALCKVIARQSKLLAHVWEKSGIKAQDLQDSGWEELLSDVFDDSDQIDNSTGEIKTSELDSIQELISDVFNPLDKHDDSEGTLEEKERASINEIISELFG